VKIFNFKAHKAKPYYIKLKYVGLSYFIEEALGSIFLSDQVFRSEDISE
jgi:hypothetical protein